MKGNLEKIKNEAIPILKEAGVIRSSLFGSYVKGENTKDSDLDILIEFPKGKSLLDLVRLQRKLEVHLGKKVDLLTYNSIHPLLKEYIQRDQFLIL